MLATELSLADSFKSAFSQHPGAVSVVTTMHDGQAAGFTATSVVSVSAEPAYVLFTIMEASSCYPAVQASDRVSIHLLSEGDAHIGQTFASRGVDRFANVDWAVGLHGTPVLEGVSRRLDCIIRERKVAGSSCIVICEVERVEAGATSPALIYANREFHSLA